MRCHTQSRGCPPETVRRLHTAYWIVHTAQCRVQCAPQTRAHKNVNKAAARNTVCGGLSALRARQANGTLATGPLCPAG